MVHKTEIASVSQGGWRESAQCTFMTRVARLPPDWGEADGASLSNSVSAKQEEMMKSSKKSCMLFAQAICALVFPCTMYIPPCLSPKL